uniref:F-box domain-containing protein n=1 Tax=Brassica oleracea TaxID=3712 RepID=A0A3P6F7W7_BRAOL|nr:unnamed protein product [Brassica oleracea]
MILSRLCTKEAVGTSVVSKRWEHVWKQVSHLVFDKPKTINSTELHDGSNPDDTLITKVINNHQGHIENCVINYSSSEGLNGILNTWIHSLTSVKHTKVLTLIRHFDCWDRTGKVFRVSVKLILTSKPHVTLTKVIHF